MILLIAKNTIKEACIQNFLEIAAKLAAETQKEPGCLQYELIADQMESTVYYFSEKYQDEAALEAHRASAHFQTYVPQLGELRTKPSEIITGQVVSL